MNSVTLAPLLTFVLLPRVGSRNLFELVSYCKFGFSRPDLDGNKLAKGVCLARKAGDREVFM